MRELVERASKPTTARRREEYDAAVASAFARDEITLRLSPSVVLQVMDALEWSQRELHRLGADDNAPDDEKTCLKNVTTCLALLDGKNTEIKT